MAFPTDDMVARGLDCAACHQEHQGAGFDLKKVSDAQCGACHVVKFDSFEGQHPPFTNYPFERRTRIIYDHEAHFGKHFPEVAKKDPTKRIPATCSTCHDSGKDKRVMSVTPFDQTCSTCHLDQITGTERVGGSKGIAVMGPAGQKRPVRHVSSSLFHAEEVSRRRPRGWSEERGAHHESSEQSLEPWSLLVRRRVGSDGLLVRREGADADEHGVSAGAGGGRPSRPLADAGRPG